MPFLTSVEEAEALAGTVFDGRTAGGTVKLRLDTVTRLGQGLRPEGESFSLVFSAPASLAFGQGTVGLSHPDGSDETLVFVVPIGREGERALYEAVFN